MSEHQPSSPVPKSVLSSSPRSLVRLIRTGALIARFALHSAAIGCLPIRSVALRRRRLALVQAYAKRATRILDVEIFEDAPFPPEWSGLFVSNHLSFLDIVVHASLRPSVFVTSNEMGELPLVGWFLRMAGAVCIERRHRGRLASDLAGLAGILRDGFSVTLFPEGTTGDGRGVLRFRAGLFPAAAGAGVAIFPTTLNYVRWNGHRVNAGDHEEICFLGHHSLRKHLGRVFSIRGATVHVSRHIPLTPAAREPRELAALSERVISGAFRAFPEPATALAGTPDSAHEHRPSHGFTAAGRSGTRPAAASLSTGATG